MASRLPRPKRLPANEFLGGDSPFSGGGGGGGANKRARRGGETLGTPIGQTPLNRARGGDYIGATAPVTDPLDQLAARDSFRAYPTLDFSAPYPGTQRMGRDGTGLPGGPTVYQREGGGGLIGALGKPPTPVTSSFGWWTNNEVNYNFVARVDSENQDRLLSRNMVLFRYIPPLKNNERWANLRNGMNGLKLGMHGAIKDDRVDVMCSLPLTNYLLRVMVTKIHGREPVASDIVKLWHCSCVASTVEWESKETQRHSETDAIQIVGRVKGPILAFNVWGSKINAGTPLWFVLKMVECPREYVINPNDMHGRVAYAKHELPKKSFQFIPWADKDLRRPPDSFVDYIDNEGRYQRGMRLLVGHAQYEPSRPNDSASHRSVFNAREMVAQTGDVWIMVGPNIPS